MIRPVTILVLTIILAIFTVTNAQANEVGPDEAVKLLEAGKVKSYEELNKIALDIHPGATIEETELEDEHGEYVYELEIRDNSGQEWDVEIDATTGEILKNRREN